MEMLGRIRRMYLRDKVSLHEITKRTDLSRNTVPLAITLEACHAKEIMQEAFARFGTPEIVNTDQGSQFTADEFTNIVLTKGCKLSMDGRGFWQRLHKMRSLVRPESPTASVGSSQATTAAVDNSAPLATRPESTYKSGKVVPTNGANSF